MAAPAEPREGFGRAEQYVSDLAATARDGQVFLTWRENALPKDALLNVYRHPSPITEQTLREAVQIGHHVQPGSARDWWKDPAAFSADAPPGIPVGFKIAEDASPLDPGSGLFVHTVTPTEADRQYYALTISWPDRSETRTFVAGQNSLASPVRQAASPTRALWVGEGPAPVAPANLPVVLRLAGGAGPNDPAYNYLAFGDATMGWREGLPFKFKLRVTKDCIDIFPSDRVWYNRVLGGPVSHFRTQTGITLHFGYNSNIYDEKAMATGTIVNYNERRLLWILEWVHRTFQTDRARVHAIGSSGGGAGLMLALHHPSVFASVCAMVPCVSYRTSTNPNLAPNDAYTKVLKLLCGDYDGGVAYDPEIGGFEYLDGVSCLRRDEEFPFLIVNHGRSDVPTPWSKVPDFYRALNDRRAGFIAWWDNGTHGAAGKQAPDDVRSAMTVEFLLRFARNRSYPAISNCSDSKNPGNGDPADGDIIGWMNRGFTWQDAVETERSYAITVRMAHGEARYPTTADITLRNRQEFKPRAGQRIEVRVDRDAPFVIHADARGAITLPRIEFLNPEYRRLELKY